MQNQSNLTDQQIIRTYIDGDSDALSILVNRHKVQILSSICLMVKDKYLAEDIFQDVFIRIINTFKKGRYTEEGKFLPWAIRIAKNMCLDYFQKLKITPTYNNNDISEELCSCETDNPIVKEQTFCKVRGLIDLLPKEQREVIILRHYGNLGFKKIAQLTNCSHNTALGRMHHGLIKMRKIIREKQITF